MAKNVKNVAIEPKRLWWVAFDADIFKELLRRLEEYNNYLHELLHGHYARKLEVTTRNTYLEMIQVRSSVEDLRSLIAAALVLGDHGVAKPLGRNALQEHNYQVLKSLAELKKMNVLSDTSDTPEASDITDNEGPPAYHDVVGKTAIDPLSISYPQTSTLNSTVRSAGTLTEDGATTSVWIEWKSYSGEADRDSNGHPVRKPLDANVTRVRELVSLLNRPHIAEFLVPRCLGFFDDREATGNSYFNV